MHRRSILTFSAITALGLALLPSSIVAQQRTLKEQLVGTWTLVSFEATAANGTKTQPYGVNPKGILIFDANGRYAMMSGGSDRAKVRNPDQPTTEERAAAQASFRANFGTWSVSEADKTLTRRYEGALFPNNEGIEFRSTVSLSGDELRLTGAPSSVTGVWRRAR